MYNPDFVAKLSFREIKGLLAHEALHPALGFWERFHIRDIKIANKAHDYAINVPIKDSPDMDLPTGGLFKEEFRNKSAEEIFFILEEEKREQAKDKSSESGDAGKEPEQGDDYTLEGDVNGDITDEIEQEYYNDARGKEVSKEEMDEIRKDAEQRWKDTLQQAFVAEKNSGKGNLPAWMVAEIEGILFPKMDFKRLLKRFFGRFGSPARPSFKHRNRRNTFTPDTFVKPRMINSLPRLYVLIDTSGSMWDQEGYRMVQGALGIIKRLANNDQYDIEIIMADTCVKEEMKFKDVMKAVKDKKLKSIGGGGSSFVSAFERIWDLAVKENMSQAPILCITDGYIDVPKKEPKFMTETAWITPPKVSPPTKKWGHHMEIDI